MPQSLFPSVLTPAPGKARQNGAAPAGGRPAGGHAHDHAPARRAPPRIGASVLRLSLAARLGLVAVLLAVLWTAVLLVAGGGA